MQPSDETPQTDPPGRGPSLEKGEADAGEPRPPWYRRWFGRTSPDAAPADEDSAEGEDAGTEEVEQRKRALKWRRHRRRAREGLVIAGKALLVAALFTFVIFFDRIVHRVLPGERGVKWLALLGGTVLDESYGEGVHVLFPWDEFYIYNMRIQELRQETLIYANDGLEIRIISSIRFRPTRDYLPLLHRDIGPNYVDKVVKPEVVSTLRMVLGNFTPEMIYAKDEAGLLHELNETLRGELNSDYFEVDEFLVTELRLPARIEEAIKAKLTEEQKMLSYRFRLEKEKDERERRIIEAEGIRAFETISGVPILKWRGLEATERLAESPNAKIILMGTGEGQLPVILNADVAPSPPRAEPAEPPEPAEPSEEEPPAGVAPIPERPAIEAPEDPPPPAPGDQPAPPGLGDPAAPPPAPGDAP